VIYNPLRLRTILPNREEYVVSTSEFDTVKARLVSLESRQPTQDEKRPTFKRGSPSGRPPDSDPDAANSKTEPTPQTQPDGRQTTEDDRPTLKRKN
jgi:hypothetical protein